MSRFDELRSLGATLHAATDQQFVDVAENLCREHRLGEGERVALYASLSFFADWSMHGAQVYELQHSIAALLAATRSPDLDWELVPLPFFILKVPSQFAPSDNVDTLIAVCSPLKVIGIINKSTSLEWMINDAFNEDVSSTLDPDKQRRWRLALRLAINAIAYITTHRECVHSSTTRDSKRSSVHTVSAPRDVVIDKAFRDQVAQLVRAGTMAELRKALAHVVRGHWRNQAVGPGLSERRLTWVRPHKRGDESLGRVVHRIERLSKACP